MSDQWAAVLAISVAVMALIQLAYFIGLVIAARKVMTAVDASQRRMDKLAADVMLRVDAVTNTVNAVANDVRGVTSRVQQVAASVADGVQRVEDQVRVAGQRVHETVDRVPPGVKKGVPVGLALLAALRTVQQVRQRLKRNRAAEDMYAAS